jgi:sugar phosphate permease
MTAAKTPTEITAEYSRWRGRIFATLWLTYASFYLCRVNLSVAQKSFGEEFHLSKTEIGGIGSALFITYAMGQFVNGQLGDRLGARILVTIGMIVSALMNVVFGFSAGLTMMVAVWAVNGYFQSCGWSPLAKTFANWFPPRQRASIGGLFGTCYQIGNAISWVLAGFIVAHFGWRAAFWIPAGLFALSAVHFVARIRNDPEDVGLPPLETAEKTTLEKATKDVVTEEGFLFSLRQSLFNPWVWAVALAYGCLNIIRIGLTQWIPHYLEEVKGTGVAEAALKAMILPLAGSLGAIVTGYAAEKRFKSSRIGLSVAMCACVGACAYLFLIVPTGNVRLSIFTLALTGFFIYGPHVLMTGAVAMDLATRKATAAATGFIDSIGYLGATLQGIVTGQLIDRYGWNYAFYFWIACAFLSALFLLPLCAYRPQQQRYV